MLYILGRFEKKNVSWKSFGGRKVEKYIALRKLVHLHARTLLWIRGDLFLFFFFLGGEGYWYGKGYMFSFWGFRRIEAIGFLPSTCVVLAKQLHAHDRKYEDYNAEDEGQIAEGADSTTHDRYEQVQCRPGLGQFENTQLQVDRVREESKGNWVFYRFRFKLPLFVGIFQIPASLAC